MSHTFTWQRERICIIFSVTLTFRGEWVAQQQQRGQNIVRFIKFQGEDSIRRLKSDDFMLVLMASVQIVGLAQFAGQMALDSTHGTNFQLTTLLVIDDHGFLQHSDTVTRSPSRQCAHS